MPTNKKSRYLRQGAAALLEGGPLLRRTMIAKRDLETLYDYGYWANGKLFQVVSQLTPEQFTQPLVGGHESIRSTLVHALSAEWGWLDRCGGPPRGARLDPNDYPTAQSVIDTWSKVEGYVREFLSKIGEEDLTHNAEYPNPAGETRIMPVGELMHHAANHAVHHRGQVALMLRLLGHAPGNIDILFYYADKRGVPAF